MQNIEQTVAKTFQTNLEYFSKEHPKLYKKLLILNQAIGDGSYIEKYSLEYKDTYFDIVELETQQYLYNQDSNIHAKILAKDINFKKSEGVVESFYNQNITNQQVSYYDKKTPIDGPIWASAKIINYANTLKSQNDEMKSIDKFIFSGVGLGIHLLTIQQKVNASYIFIIEDNLELFRLSLFVTPYNILAKTATLFLSVMETEYDFTKSFESFFLKAYNYNQYIKYSIFSSINIKHIKQIQAYVVSAQYLSFPYSSQLKELLKAPEYLIQGYPFLNISSTHNNDFLDDKPVLLLASGPSLGNNIQWLKENHHKFVIIAVLTTSQILYKANIKPDIIVHIDAGLKNWTSFIKDIDVKAFFKDTLILFSSVITRELVDKFDKNNAYCFETASDYKREFGIITSPSVGETTYALSLILGAKNLYLLGLDLALDPKTNLTHSKEHISSKEVKQSLDQKQEQYTDLRKSTIKIKGNFLNEVSTLPLFQTSIAGFNRFSKLYLTKQQNVYNLNNGAYLEGTIPLHVEELETKNLSTLDKKEKFDKLKKFLNSISEDKINNQDIDNLQKQLNEAQRLYDYLEEFNKNVNTSNYSIYMKSFYSLSSEFINIDKEEKEDINIVFHSYLMYVTGYIFDIFNTKNLKNTKRHLKKVNKIFVEQCKKILDLYITTMEVYLEFAEAQNKKD